MNFAFTQSSISLEISRAIEQAQLANWDFYLWWLFPFGAPKMSWGTHCLKRSPSKNRHIWTMEWEGSAAYKINNSLNEHWSCRKKKWKQNKKKFLISRQKLNNDFLFIHPFFLSFSFCLFFFNEAMTFSGRKICIHAEEIDRASNYKAKSICNLQKVNVWISVYS